MTESKRLENAQRANPNNPLQTVSQTQPANSNNSQRFALQTQPANSNNSQPQPSPNAQPQGFNTLKAQSRCSIL